MKWEYDRLNLKMRRKKKKVIVYLYLFHYLIIKMERKAHNGEIEFLDLIS